MLKVVGASWYKTKVACCLLVTLITTFILLLLTLFFTDIEFSHETDSSYSYCATAFWSPETGIRMEYFGLTKNFDNIPNGIAKACYRNSEMSVGWSQFEVETQPGYSDHYQADAAGVLEGTLTWSVIYKQYVNTVQAYCEKSEMFCSWLRGVLETNYKTIKHDSDRKAHHDHYWYQIKLFFHQLNGMRKGFLIGARRARKDVELDMVDFLMLNAGPDMEDLKTYYLKIVNDEAELTTNPSNKAKTLLKVVERDGVPKILLGHTSEGEYSSMLKVFKKYRLRYFYLGHRDSLPIPNAQIEFSSYPGSLASPDDFYVIRGKHRKILVSGVRINYNNPISLRSINLETFVLLGARTMTANRLAKTPRGWAEFMTKNPGFGMKQWVIVDEKKLTEIYPRLVENENMIHESTADPSSLVVTSATTTDPSGFSGKMTPHVVQIEPQKLIEKREHHELHNAIWIADQLPDRVRAIDVTREFNMNGYLLLNGTIYSKELEELSKTSAVKPYKNNPKIENFRDVANILESGAWRGDLLSMNRIPFGNTDIKLYINENVMDDEEDVDDVLLVKSGPPFNENSDKSTPFNWDSADFDDVPHNGQPNVFDFDYFRILWSWRK